MRGRNLRPSLALTILAAVASLATAAPAPAAAPRPQTGTVVRAVDGDSVSVRVAGRVRIFNLLGLNAPDGRQCFAASAKAALARLLPRGGRVTLLRDRHRAGAGRYMFRNGRFVNAALLRAGDARASGLGGLSRAGTLRVASRIAQNGDRGLFGNCGGTSPGTTTPPPAPGPIDVAKSVRNALTGKQLVDLVSTPRSSTRNTTRFCQGGRSDRTESFTGESGNFNNTLAGTWAVFTAVRDANGTITAEITFQPDNPSFDPRSFTVSIASDGTVRREGANASELQGGGPCSPSQAPAGFENDTATAHNRVSQALTGKRLDEGSASATNDFCSAQRAIRREGGNVAVDGPWSVEWAAGDSSGTLAVLALADSDSSASRRILVAIPSSGPAQVRNLGEAGATGHNATLAGVSC